MFGMKLYMFRTVPLFIISFSLYTQQRNMSHGFADSLRAGSGWNNLILLAKNKKFITMHGHMNIKFVYHVLNTVILIKVSCCQQKKNTTTVGT